MKYNLDDLHWQEFETLVFKVLQILVAPGVQYLPGGNDKGRDIVYYGPSAFNTSYKNWIFQCKHKSKEGVEKDITASLTSDLRQELKKVFITNGLQFDVYFLVTNKEINADAFDKLRGEFQEFKQKNTISCQYFDIISYHHIESCIDQSDRLKWSYPNIIAHPDFQTLILNSVNIHLNNRRRGWLTGIQRQRERFVFTDFFQLASEKLSKFPAIILSGPPKSGKTFNAEMLVLNLYTYREFQPVLVENLDDLESGFNDKIKQVFIFDDAFGKYSLSYESKEWFHRLEHIFELADDCHLFIFTSREYIFREFLNYGNESAQTLLKKIIVESHNYSKEEKLAMLNRYTRLSTLDDNDKRAILFEENTLTAHKNFSPETIRAFFSNLSIESAGSQLKKLKDHLEKPDSYLFAVFVNLPRSKQAALISVLCAVKNTMDVLKKTYNNVCRDLAMDALVNAAVEFDELDDSILRISKTSSIESVRFYHPSMEEFLIKQVIGNDAIMLKEVVLKNLNSDLLSLSRLVFAGGKRITYDDIRQVGIERGDLLTIRIGIFRLVQNEHSSLHQLAEAFGWFTIPQHTLDLKLNDPVFCNDVQQLLMVLAESVFSQEFFFIHRNESCQAWGSLLRSIKNSFTLYLVSPMSFDLTPLSNLLNDSKKSGRYWILVFRSLFFLNSSTIKSLVGSDWLNAFYLDLKKDIDGLGEEVYGQDFPDFNEYLHQVKVKRVPVDKVKTKPSKTWYPRFSYVEDRMEMLKEVKGTEISQKILQKLVDRYAHIKGLKEYAKNRHKFIVAKGWWNDNIAFKGEEE